MKPFYKFLQMWRCLANVVVPIFKKVKIDPKIIDCIFIGYANNNIVCLFLVHESKILVIYENMIMESRSALFFEYIFPYKSKEGQCSSKLTFETITENIQNQEHEENERFKIT